MRVLSTTTINIKAENGTDKLIADAEANYCRQLAAVVEELIAEKDEKPVILLSGPSGSGKTTSAFRIRRMLCNQGINTYTMSMDNYFIPMGDPRTVYEEDGSVDFESPARLEAEQLADHLEKMWSGEAFTLPVFDFVAQKQIPGARFKRGKDEMVILEGIHALNPEITGLVSEHSAGVYVSVRTRVKSHNGTRLHPAKIRLARRLIRDTLFRGRSVEQVLQNFANVQRGEEKYIIPYKRYAECQVDTFMAYELSAYKPFLGEALSAMRDGEYDNVVKKLNLVLGELESVGLDGVPCDSLLREFTGGSEFEY